jgi:ATP-dependent Clp protease ATP-binding subunit ClpB
MTSNIKIEELRTRLAPEFINRIDDIIHFNNLGLEQIRQICRLQLESLRSKLSTAGIVVSYSDVAVDLLSELSYEPQYGARPVKRAVNDHIVNGLTMKLLSREITKDRGIVIDADNNSFIFKNVE